MQASIKSFFCKPLPAPAPAPAPAHVPAPIPPVPAHLSPPAIFSAQEKSQSSEKVELSDLSHLEPSLDVPPSMTHRVTDYQRLREENIRRNSDFLAQLGLHEVADPATNDRPSKKRAFKETSARNQATKRIQPKRGAKSLETNSTAVIDPASDSASDSEEKAEELPFDDSSVLKYVISTAERSPPSQSCLSSGKPGEAIPTLHPLPSLRCDSLAAVYSLHPHPTIPSLLVAAGKGGIAAIYSTSPSRDLSLDDGSRAPLLHFKAHSRWISSAKFLSPRESVGETEREPLSAAIRLLTAADDGLLKLWDLARCTQNSDPQLLSSLPLHEKGIFSMDESAGQILTGSKDRSVSLSVIHPSGEIQRAQLFQDLHGSVVKSVHWKPVLGSSPVIFASGSQDSSVAVQDIRSPTPSLCIASAHAGGVHTVSWSPLLGSSDGSAEFLLMSAGYDSAVKLYDIRHCTSATATPLHIFQERNPSSRSSTIVTPSFLTSRSLLIPNESSFSISINCTTTGRTLSRGTLEEQPLSVVCSHHASDVPNYAFAACKRKGIVMPLTVLWTQSLN
jgi:hypothetical protein